MVAIRIAVAFHHHFLLEGKLIVDETILEFSIRIEPALIRLSQQVVSVICHAVVDDIAQEARHDVPAQPGNRFQRQQPQRRQGFRYSENGVRLGVGAVLGDEDDGADVIGPSSVGLQQRSADVGLQGGEAQLAIGIPIQSQVDGPVAEVADAVEEDDRALVLDEDLLGHLPWWEQLLLLLLLIKVGGHIQRSNVSGHAPRRCC
mmetsp:Transcript_24311/g.68331  ORF Transcript_24311/g.68331 Transcript_24311/m.68331 type:complete len:203 (-) Transcript_24311:243-851(-)